MNIQQVKTKLTEQFAKYLKEIGQQTVSEFQEAKKNKRNSNIILAQPEKKIVKEYSEIQNPEIINLDDFKFEKKVDNQDWKIKKQQAIQANQLIYHKEYGYCVEQTKFEAMMERLLLLRKSLHKKRSQSTLLSDLEDFIPLSTLQQLAKQLPTDSIEINRIVKDQQCAETFLKEIKYFIKSQSIDKALIFYHPNMFDETNILDEICELYQNFEEMEKRRSGTIESNPMFQPQKQFKI